MTAAQPNDILDLRDGGTPINDDPLRLVRERLDNFTTAGHLEGASTELPLPEDYKAAFETRSLVLGEDHARATGAPEEVGDKTFLRYHGDKFSYLVIEEGAQNARRLSMDVYNSDEATEEDAKARVEAARAEAEAARLEKRPGILGALGRAAAHILRGNRPPSRR